MTEKNVTNSLQEQNKEFNDPVQPENKPKKNKSKRKYVIGSLIILILITGIVGLGFAGEFRDKHRGDGHFRFMLEKVAKELNLNDQQQAEVNRIKDEIKAKMDENKQKRKDQMSEMEKMFRSDTFDKQKIIDMDKMRETKREEMRTFMIDEMAKFHALLTSEQRNKAADLMKEKHEKMGRFDDNFRGPGRDKDGNQDRKGMKE
jgi:Spy/CpxP family protein refolding chaperone